AGRSALMAWLKTVSRSVAADGVTVNGVLPGRHDTPRIEQLDEATAARTGRTRDEVRAAHLANIPAGRYGTAEEVASLVTYLCSEPARYQTGTFSAVDGGMLTGLPWRAAARATWNRKPTPCTRPWTTAATRRGAVSGVIDPSRARGRRARAPG